MKDPTFESHEHCEQLRIINKKSNIEKDVGDVLLFIAENKDRNRADLISEEISELIETHGLNEIIINLKSRSNTPLILWTIDVIKQGIKNGK